LTKFCPCTAFWRLASLSLRRIRNLEATSMAIAFQKLTLILRGSLQSMSSNILSSMPCWCKGGSLFLEMALICARVTLSVENSPPWTTKIFFKTRAQSGRESKNVYIHNSKYNSILSYKYNPEEIRTWKLLYTTPARATSPSAVPSYFSQISSSNPIQLFWFLDSWFPRFKNTPSGYRSLKASIVMTTWLRFINILSI